MPPNNGTQHSGFFETEFVQRSDGSVLALLRWTGESSQILYSVSTDLMKSWTAWQDYNTCAPSSSSRMWLGRTPSGRLLFCWNNDLIRRTLTVGLSDDDGATYPYRVVLEPSSTGQVSYPIVEFGDNGEIFVIYDNERTAGKRQIRIAKVMEKEIVAGTSVPVVKIVSNPATP
ncbi:sialidase family protein [Pseudomonas ovata]|uniref:sialidase family protein n=1 Tax=Pseudomonas ovata TaxID=1839709 RepID=UPI000D685DE0